MTDQDLEGQKLLEADKLLLNDNIGYGSNDGTHY